MKWIVTTAFAIIPGAIFAESSTNVDASSDAQQVVRADAPATGTVNDTVQGNKINIKPSKVTLASGSTLNAAAQGNKITPGTNDYNEAANELKQEAADKAKADAQAQADAKAKADADAANAQQATAQAPQTPQQSNSATPATNNSTPASTAGKSYGTFKLSFYDPAIMGSNMGYGGVAANLSVFPKGTQLKITLSDGTVWYRTVNDTGSFADGNSHQLDVAMPNNAIPSAGVLTATVEVVG